MKKIVLALILALALTTPALATIADWQGAGWYQEGTSAQYYSTNPSGHTNATFIGTTLGGGSTNTNTINNNPTNNNTVTTTSTGGNVNIGNVGGGSARQRQNQSQTQVQDQNNDQTIAPTQQVIIETPRQPVGIPGSGVSELNFGNGKMSDATLKLPKFALWGISPLSGKDMITEVLCIKANIKFKDMYKLVLEEGKKIAEKGKTNLIRYQIVEVESQKSWTTGGSLNGGGSGFVNGSAVAGGGSLIPQIGRTKADFLYHVIFVKVVKDC